MSRKTLKDVAEIAGTSVSTASLVLSGKGRISAEVRDRVIQVAGEIGYFKRPDVIRPDGRSNRDIGMLYSFDSDWSYVQTFLGPMVVLLEDQLRRSGHYLSLIALTRKNTSEELFERILRDNLKAVLSVHYMDDDLFRRLEELGIPVVVINNLENQNSFYSAGVDDFQGSYEGATYLHELGHRVIAYIDYHRADLPTLMNRRYLGFKTGLEESGLSFNEDYHIRVYLNDYETLSVEMKALFSRKPRPTAIFAHDDYLVMYILKSLASLNLRVPEEVSIIAHGDTLEYSKAFTPRITTLKINTAQLGKLAVEMLMNRIDNQPEDIHVIKLKEQLIDRGSCRRID